MSVINTHKTLTKYHNQPAMLQYNIPYNNHTNTSATRRQLHQTYMYLDCIFRVTMILKTSSQWTAMFIWLQHACSCPLFWQAILTRKIGHIDLVFGARSGIISRSVQARLQVCVQCAAVICAMLVNRQTHTQHFTSLQENLSQPSYYCK